MSAPRRARSARRCVPEEARDVSRKTQGYKKHYIVTDRSAAAFLSDGEVAATKRPAHSRAFPHSYMGFAAGFRRRIMGCRGAFAHYVRLACRPGRDPLTTPVMHGANRTGPALFPLPLMERGTRTRLPPNGRAVRVDMRRRAVIEMVNSMILFLNFEEGGRR